MIDKRMVRETALNLRASLTREEREVKSQKILSIVKGLSKFKAAKTIMSFLNFRDEVDTTLLAVSILESGKRLILPRCASHGILIPAEIHDLNEDIEPGKWGIREPKGEKLNPVNPEEIEMIIIPGAAFDRQGNRLGYGGGYYDRFLNRLRPETPKIALAFSCQILPEIPLEPFDFKMDALVTEEGILWFKSVKEIKT
ncbi:5-formyltetrahydrofolate cyclo-ligase [Desulfitobacterium sp.]|uniref:5-formyltetrahydrofolate cyclo-ligase n=1 Tax=Desulfitobacterium sp. TaxID=49981 RepID=UPI002B21819E|nr:5-formyltetrahydrofolate cyclo-ligase [Desulfitobacterium sp.]MEA4901818.1 5-formyltetrahydrofolate cyclo-ligase [Desulfitobacterium sp.]